MKLLILFISVYSVTIFANPRPKKSNHTHRHHEAHVHGAGTLAIAFEENIGKIEFKAAAEGVLGFEYKPKNKKNQKAVDDAILKFQDEITKMVQFESQLNCQFTKEQIGQVPEEGGESSGEHSDWAANFKVTCSKSPTGTSVKIDFSNFKLIKNIDITVLIGSLQKNVEFKKNPIVIDLK